MKCKIPNSHLQTAVQSNSHQQIAIQPNSHPEIAIQPNSQLENAIQPNSQLQTAVRPHDGTVGTTRTAQSIFSTMTKHTRRLWWEGREGFTLFCTEQHSATGRDSNHILLQSKLHILHMVQSLRHFFYFSGQGCKMEQESAQHSSPFSPWAAEPSCASNSQFAPSSYCTSSCLHLLLGRPTFLLPVGSVHLLSSECVYPWLSINARCTCFYKSTTVSFIFYIFISHISSLCLRSIT